MNNFNRRNCDDGNMHMNVYDCSHDDRCKLVNDHKKCGMCPAFYPKPTAFPKFYPQCAPFPKFEGETTMFPEFEGQTAPFPKFEGETTTFPQFVGEEVTFYIPKFEEKVIEIPVCKPCCCDCCNICEQQLKYVLNQLIEKYPDDNWVINLEEARSIPGTPVSLCTEKNQGLLCFDEEDGEGSKREYVNVCKIASITITSADYDPTIQYLPDPKEESYCGCADSVLAKLNEVVTGETVNINVGGQSTGECTLLQNHIGIVALKNDGSLIFVNSCMINSFTIKDNP